MAVAFRLRSRPAIGEWSVDQVCDFLESIGLSSDIRELFKKEAIDGSVLCQISNVDLSSEPFKLPFGVRKTLLAEVQAQAKHARARQRQQATGQGVRLAKGAIPQGPCLSVDALERIRAWKLEPSSGRLMPRDPPLSDEELECWQYQAAWLICPITGKAWARSDVVSTMGVALYHAPRFCSEKEKQRLFIEEEQARRYDAERKAMMDHSGTAFEREYEVYPVVEPPPLVNLPMTLETEGSDSGDQATATTDQLQQLKTEASGLKGRSAAVQRQMFEGLAGSGGEADTNNFLDSADVQRALNELKTEPREDDELARKFGLYESYFSGVVELRGDLFGLWDRGRDLLKPQDARSMSSALKQIDKFENLSIPERSRFWFVYHMMSTASENHTKMQRVLEDLEQLFETACDSQNAAVGDCSAEDLTDDPQLGVMQVIIGPAFDIDAYNDGVNGNASKSILSAADRGVLDMDRQYNAVNFQFFKQRAEAGVTREGAEASFERRLCTSRLSFYIDESHGSRVFPRNILSQLSLLFYRRNDALRLSNGKVHEHRVAVCIRKAIPRILRAIVIDVFQGDRSFAPHVEKAVRLYLAVHQVAIKLLATFRKSYELLYQSVVEWIQQPFCPKSDNEWPDLEELLLGASLCSLPWPLLREAFVRKLFASLQKNTTQMSAKASIRQRSEHLFSQNRLFLERLAYIMAFFQTGPGKLPVLQMDQKYTRCAGTIPKSERDALVAAAQEGSGASSLIELWGVLGMRRRSDLEDEAVLTHIEQFISYVQANEAAWRAAAPPVESSEGPSLPPAALEQLASIGAESSGGVGAHVNHGSQGKRERELAKAQRLAAERALHQGYPKLPNSRRLDGTMCYYCQRRFPSRMALFAHLRKVIDKDRFFEGHHQTHFDLKVAGGPAGLGAGPHKCLAKNCGKSFGNSDELWSHYNEMGVPGFEELPPCKKCDGQGNASQLNEESGPALANSTLPAEDMPSHDLAHCSVCMDRAPEVVMVPCGHIYACEKCGKKLSECAICRMPVKQVLRVYYSS